MRRELREATLFVAGAAVIAAGAASCSLAYPLRDLRTDGEGGAGSAANGSFAALVSSAESVASQMASSAVSSAIAGSSTMSSSSTGLPAGCVHLVFTTNGVSLGNVSPSAADGLCAQEAMKAGLGDMMWKALKASTNVDGKMLITVKGKVCLASGAEVAANTTEWWSQSHKAAIKENAKGMAVTGLVWTGMTWDGTHANTCSDWISTNNNVKGQVGDSEHMSFWANSDVGLCGTPYHHYCMSQVP
jgi:hypothetical protein